MKDWLIVDLRGEDGDKKTQNLVADIEASGYGCRLVTESTLEHVEKYEKENTDEVIALKKEIGIRDDLLVAKNDQYLRAWVDIDTLTKEIECVKGANRKIGKKVSHVKTLVRGLRKRNLKNMREIIQNHLDNLLPIVF